MAQGIRRALPADCSGRRAEHAYARCRGRTGRRLCISKRKRCADETARIRLKLWWLVDSARFAREKAAVEGLEKEGWFKIDRWQAVEAQLNVFGTIRARGHGYAIRLVYPH